MVASRETSTKKDATYEDILALPEHVNGELVDGELIVSPRPASRHGRATTKLGARLDAFDREPGADEGPSGWIFIDEPELHFGKNVLIPDLAGWRRERQPDLADRAWIADAPDWVCEVLSPSTQRADRILKLPRYRSAGVAWAWLVQPIDQLVEVFRGEGQSWVLAATGVGDDVIRLPPFEALELSLADLWRF